MGDIDVDRESFDNVFPRGMWAAMVSRRETRLTNAVGHHFLKFDLIAHT